MRDTPKTVDDWRKVAVQTGLVGSATIVTDINGARQSTIVDISDDGGASKTKIPRNLLEHVAELLRERDRLVAASIKASMDHEPPKMASLRESCLLLAIDTIRKKYAAPETEIPNG